MKEHLLEFQKLAYGLSAQELVDWSVETFGAAGVVLSSSLSLEDQALTDMLIRKNPEARILTLDTGRVFQETYDVMQETMKKYGMRYEIYFPDYKEVEKMERTYGPNLFFESAELRKLCCQVRKVKPLKRALSGAKVWIVGLRRAQSVTRKELQPIEWDEQFGIFKISPLFDWNSREVWNYVKDHEIPFNKLFDKGYESIGCAPCTRPVCGGDDERSGRWWWESPEKKECGLHTHPPAPSHFDKLSAPLSAEKEGE